MGKNLERTKKALSEIKKNTENYYVANYKQSPYYSGTESNLLETSQYYFQSQHPQMYAKQYEDLYESARKDLNSLKTSNAGKYDYKYNDTYNRLKKRLDDTLSAAKKWSENVSRFSSDPDVYHSWYSSLSTDYHNMRNALNGYKNYWDQFTPKQGSIKVKKDATDADIRNAYTTAAEQNWFDYHMTSTYEPQYNGRGNLVRGIDTKVSLDKTIDRLEKQGYTREAQWLRDHDTDYMTESELTTALAKAKEAQQSEDASRKKGLSDYVTGANKYSDPITNLFTGLFAKRRDDAQIEYEDSADVRKYSEGLQRFYERKINTDKALETALRDYWRASEQDKDNRAFQEQNGFWPLPSDTKPQQNMEDARKRIQQLGYNPDTYIKAFEKKTNREAVQEAYDAASTTKTGAVLGSALSALSAPMRGLGGVVSTVGKLAGKEIDPDDSVFLVNNLSTAIRQGVQDGYTSEWFGGASADVLGKDYNVGNFLYNTLMSGLDSAVNMYVASGVLGALGAGGVATEQVRERTANLTSLLMSSEVYTDELINAKRNGWSDAKAITWAATKGVIEAATEKYSIEAILNPSAGVFRQLGKAFLAEGSEEVTGNILETVADVVYNGDKSEIMSNYYRARNNGASESKAAMQALGGFMLDNAEAFLSGGLSGMAMGATGTGAQLYNDSRTGKNITVKGVTDDVLQTAVRLNLDDNADLAKRIAQAQARQRAEKSAGNIRLGQIARLGAEQASKQEAQAAVDVMTQQLVEQGLSETSAAAAAEAYVKHITGQELTRADRKTLRNMETEQQDAQKTRAHASELNEVLTDAERAFKKAVVRQIGGSVEGKSAQTISDAMAAAARDYDGTVTQKMMHVVQNSLIADSQARTTTQEAITRANFEQMLGTGSEAVQKLQQKQASARDAYDTLAQNIYQGRAAEKAEAAQEAKRLSDVAAAAKSIDKFVVHAKDSVGVSTRSGDEITISKADIDKLGDKVSPGDKAVLQAAMAMHNAQDANDMMAYAPKDASALVGYASAYLSAYQMSERGDSDAKIAEVNGSLSQEALRSAIRNGAKGASTRSAVDGTHYTGRTSAVENFKPSKTRPQMHRLYSRDGVRSYQQRGGSQVGLDYIERVLNTIARTQRVNIALVDDLGGKDFGANGFLDSNGNVIYVSLNSENPILTTVSHELWHMFEQEHGAVRGAISASVNEYLRDAMTDDYDGYLERLAQRYEKNLSDPKQKAVVLEEAAANSMFSALSDEGFLTRLQQDNPKLFDGLMSNVETFLSNLSKQERNLFGGTVRSGEDYSDTIPVANALRRSVENLRKVNETFHAVADAVSQARAALLDQKPEKVVAGGGEPPKDEKEAETKAKAKAKPKAKAQTETAKPNKADLTARMSAMKQAEEERQRKEEEEAFAALNPEDDVPFSLQAPVEETRDLIAVHNLTEQNLLDTLELGGFPSPSIAIVKANMGHTKFGPISILFRKNTIDPARARNKVYGADAWTPTAGQAKVEYKANRDVEQKISDVYYDLYHKYGERARGLYAMGNYAADEITRRGLDNIVADLKQDDRLKEVYLLERGYTLPDVEIRQEPVYAAPETAEEAEKFASYILFRDALPDGFAEQYTEFENLATKRRYFSEHEAEIRNAMVKAGVPDAESLDEKDALRFTNVALRYNPTEMKTVEDRTARDRAVRETDAKGYEAWIDDLLDGIVEKKGIFNGKDMFTASGNRRSFEALHYEYNLANIVRAMNAAPDKGIGGFGNNIIGAAVKEYASIDEVRADKERLRLINEDEYQELKKNYLERLGDIADRFARDPDDWQNREAASDLLVEAIVNRKTRSGIASYLKKEGAGWTRYSDSVVDDLIELANDVAQMPTGYFEAKPKRGVGFDEVAFAVVPDNASETLIAALKGRNVETYTYPAGDDEARKAVVNAKAEQAQDVRFSLAGVRSETADKSMLQLAEDMEKQARTSEEIRQATGWFRGLDGKWRYEIDDSTASLVENPDFDLHYTSDGDVYRTARLKDILSNAKLLEAYPELGDITVIIQQTHPGMEGAFFQTDRHIVLTQSLFERYTKEYNDYLNGGRKREIAEIEKTPEYREYRRFFDDEDLSNRLSPEEWLRQEQEAHDKFFNSELGKRYYQLKWGKVDIRKFEPGWSKEAKAVLFHELQHAVQEIEGFAKGGNIRNPDYDRMAGEIEARDTANRLNLTAEERRAKRPDIDRNDVAFRFSRKSDAQNEKFLQEYAVMKADPELRKAIRQINRTLTGLRSELAQSEQEKAAAKEETKRTRAIMGGLLSGASVFGARARNQLDTLVNKWVREYKTSIPTKELYDRLETVLSGLTEGEANTAAFSDDTMYALWQIGYDVATHEQVEEMSEARKAFRKAVREQKIYIDSQEKAELISHFGSWKNFREQARRHGLNYTTTPGAQTGARSVDELLHAGNNDDGDHSILFDWTDGTYDLEYFNNGGEGPVPSATEFIQEIFDIMDGAGSSVVDIEAEYDAWLAEESADLIDIENQKRATQFTLDVVEGIAKYVGPTLADQLAQVKSSRDRLEKKYEPLRERAEKYASMLRSGQTIDSARMNLRREVMRLHKKLAAPNPNAFVPDDLRQAAASVVNIFTQNTSVFDERQLALVQTFYENLLNNESDDPNYNIQSGEEMLEMIGRLGKLMKGRHLAKLDLDELIAATQIVQHFNHLASTYGKTLRDGKWVNRAEVNNAALEDMEKRGKRAKLKRGIAATDTARKAQGAVANFMVQEMIPDYFFGRIGGEFEKVWQDVSTGASQWGIDVAAAKTFWQGLSDEYGAKEWLKDKKDNRKTFKLESGETVELTMDEIFGIYAAAKREQENGGMTNHVLGGGIRFLRDVKTTEQRNGKTVSGVKQEATAYKLTVGDLQKIENAMSEKQTEFVDKAVDYLSTVLADKGNQTSLLEKGYSTFLERYYYPFHIDPATKDMSADDSKAQNSTRMIKNFGMTKSLTPGASNALIVEGFSDVWSMHVNEMAQYANLSIPQQELRQLFNHKYVEISDKGTQDTSFTDKSRNMRAAIGNAYGSAYETYIQQLLKDMSGTVNSDPAGKIQERLLSMFKAAAVMANMSVVIQQPSAIMRALAEIDPKYFFANSHAFSVGKQWDEMMKYSGTAVMKDIGGFELGTGKSMSGWMTGVTSGREKFNSAMSWGAERADKRTWVYLWNIVKRETKAKTGLSGEELLKAAGKRFDEVAAKTQVFDSKLNKSGFMRSQNGLAKLATAFMAEPTKSFNMLMDGVYKMRDATDKSARVAGMKVLGRAVVAYAAASILNELLQSIVGAMRDKDEDRTLWEKYIANFTQSILSDANLLGLVPIGRDVVSIFQGFDASRSDLEPIIVLKDAVESTMDALADGKGWEDAVVNDLDLIGRITGIPVKNLSRLYTSVRNVIAKTAYKVPEGQTETRFKLTLDEALRDAMPKVLSDHFFEVFAYDKVVDEYIKAVGGDKDADKRSRELYAVLDDRLAVRGHAEDEDRDEYITNKLRNDIKARMLGGEITEDTALTLLRDYLHDGAQSYVKILGWKADEGDSKYAQFVKDASAYINGDYDALESAVKYLTDHGVNKTTAINAVKGIARDVKSAAQAMANGDMESYEFIRQELIDSYNYDEDQLDKDIARYSYLQPKEKKEPTYVSVFDVEDMADAYFNGNMTAYNHIRDDLKKTGKDDKKLNSSMKTQVHERVEDGRLSKDQAMAWLVKNLDVDVKDGASAQDIAKARENAAFIQMRKWETGEDATGYTFNQLADKFVQSGSDADRTAMQKEINILLEHGVDAGTISGWVTKLCKPKYVQMYKKGDTDGMERMEERCATIWYYDLGYNENYNKRNTFAYERKRVRDWLKD